MWTIEDVTYFLKNPLNSFYEIEDDLEEYYYDSGSFGKVYHIDGYMLKVRHIDEDVLPFNLQESMTYEGEILKKLEPLGITPKVYDYSDMYVVMEKIDGIPMWALTPKEAKDIDLVHFINLMKDIELIAKLGYRANDVNTNNVFWCGEEVGFRLIDVGLYKKEKVDKIQVPKFLIHHNFFNCTILPKLKEVYDFDLDYVEKELYAT